MLLIEPIAVPLMLLIEAFASPLKDFKLAGPAAETKGAKEAIMVAIGADD